MAQPTEVQPPAEQRAEAQPSEAQSAQDPGQAVAPVEQPEAAQLARAPGARWRLAFWRGTP
eukprot:7536871-Alexandrium_andersonii.AAC.1